MNWVKLLFNITRCHQMSPDVVTVPTGDPPPPEEELFVRSDTSSEIKRCHCKLETATRWDHGNRSSSGKHPPAQRVLHLVRRRLVEIVKTDCQDLTVFVVLALRPDRTGSDLTVTPFTWCCNRDQNIHVASWRIGWLMTAAGSNTVR